MKYSDLQDNIADDGIEKEHRTDTRRPILTIRHLLKLKKIRELKNLEKKNLLNQLSIIYEPVPSENGGMSGI